MSIRELLGLVLLIGGVAITPLGWIISHKILVGAAALMAVGTAMFYTERVSRREERRANEAARTDSGRAGVPADVHNYSGWRNGGRAETLDSALHGGEDEH